jgi:hypothetical protein
VCIECFTDTKAKARGFVRQSLIEFISSQLKQGALPPHKIELLKQVSRLLARLLARSLARWLAWLLSPVRCVDA